MKRLATTIVLSGLLAVAPAWSQGPIKVGDQFQVNSYTTDTQASPFVAADAQSNFVVVWGGYGPGTEIGGYSIQAQLFDAQGLAVGNQFQANTYTTGFQSDPRVAVAPQGDFVVVWGSMFSDSERNRSVQAQRFDASGTEVGTQFQVNSYTTGIQQVPAVATDSQGNFVVVWLSDGSYESDQDEDHSIQARRYSANGSPLAGQFQINAYTTGSQTYPSIGVNADGRFVVVWQSEGSAGTDSSGYSIQGQRFNANGTKVGGEFQVNTLTTLDQTYPSVSVSTAGDFVVAWQSESYAGTDNSGQGLRAQRFNAAGAKVGGEFQVNTTTDSDQTYPIVTSDATGDFVIVWSSYSSGGMDTSATSIQGQSFDAMGNPLGGEFQVNTYTTSYQDFPAAVFRPDGDVVVVWQSKGGDGTDTGGNGGQSIQGQIFSTNIFADGFESGDTSAWSTSVP